jgi:hypothetical protein
MRRLGLLFLVALTSGVPAAAPPAVWAGEGSGPSQLWQTYPLGPHRHTTQHRPAAGQVHPRPDATGTRTSRSAAQERPTGGFSGSGEPLGWLLATGVVAIGSAGALYAGRRMLAGASLRPAGAVQTTPRRQSPAAMPVARATPDLSGMSRAELYQLAAKLGVEGRSRMSRERLIEVLDDAPAKGGTG